jgi:hypothetical protein
VRITFPRKLTGWNGNTRWQGASGRTFDNLDEATADCPPPEPDQIAEVVAPKPLARSRFEAVSVAALYYTIAAGGVWTLYSLMIGDIEVKGWLEGLAVTGWGVWATGGVAGGSSAAISVHQENFTGWGNRAVEAWARWLKRLVKLALIVVGLILAYVLLTAVFKGLFEGVSKGTVLISCLLFAILITLIGQQGNQRR